MKPCLSVSLSILLFTSAQALASAEVIEVKTPSRTIVLGVTQPDSSIVYFDQGLRLVTEKIREILAKRWIPGDFFQMMSEDSELRGRSFQLGRHIIPEEVVPLALRDIGIDLTHFVLPDDKLTPEAFEESYDVDYGERDKPVYQDLSRLDFMKLVELYRTTHSLPFFKLIRRSVVQDSYYDFGSTALAWSFTLLKVEACLFTGHAVLGFWKNLLGTGILQSKIFSSLAASLTYLLSFSFITKVTDEVISRNPEDLSELYSRIALANYGVKGMDYLKDNEVALEDLAKGSALGDFISDRDISRFLLHPSNHYDIVKMSQNYSRVDRKLLEGLLAHDEGAIQKLTALLAPPEGKKPLENLEEIVRIGTYSPLWCELAVLAVVSDSGLYVYSDNKGATITAHSNSGEISLKPKDYFHPGRMSAVLGHEFWHRAKVSYRDAEIFRYYDKNEYARAFAAEEVIATLVESKIMREISEQRRSFKENIIDLLERVNPTKYDLVIDLYGINTYQDQVSFLFKHMRSHHWDHWRDE